jgi:hypothetical protein
MRRWLSPKQAPGRPPSFVPRLEALEARALLSCTVTVSGTTLSITGDNGNNSVQVIDRGSPGAGNITAICDGMTTTPPGAISTIRINTNAGNDAVSYTLAGNLTGFRRVSINLGTGNDSFNGQIAGSLFNGSDFQISGQGSTGNDSLAMTVAGSLLNGSSLKANLDGGTGNDMLVEQTTGSVMDGSLLQLDASGSTGNDVLFSNLASNVTNGSQLQTHLDGGTGNDVLRLHAGDSAIQNGSALILSVTGGDGNDDIGLDTQTSINGSLSLTADGGTGNDLIVARVRLDPLPGSQGLVRARVQGSQGNDTLRLVVRRPRVDMGVDLNAAILGGSGFDSCHSTPNVRHQGCEA